MTTFITGLPYSGIEDVIETLSYSGNDANWSNLGKIVSSIIPHFDVCNNSVEALLAFIDAYASIIERCPVFDASYEWAENIPRMCSWDPNAKFICMVSNPATIIATNERAYREGLLFASKSNIASRAYAFASPEGLLGHQYAQLKDAVTMGLKPNMLFVDYDKLLKMPAVQYARISEFLGGAVKLNINETDYIPINPVEYIGLELYQQYNREIFWDAWV